MRYSWFHFLFLASSALLLAAPGYAQTDAFQGSVHSSVPADQPLSLSLNDALQRGLRYNLGAMDSRLFLQRARGESIAARSALLPNLNGNLREVVQQNDLAVYGFKFNLPSSFGVSFPSVVGPYNYFDLRGFLTQRLADVQAIRTYQSARAAQRAAVLSVADARDTVVYVVTAGYLRVLAESARVDSAKAQVQSAQAIYQQASDRFDSGLSAKIDVTRSQVELQTQQGRLTAEQGELAKQKIILARLIGVPSGQQLILTDKMPYAPLENLTLEQAIALASQNRADLQAAEAQVHAAELARKAASAERYPTLGIGADYGVIGINPANSHGTFSVTGQLQFPLWQGGRIRGDIEQADATLQRRRAEYDDLRAKVEAEVRTAYLDLNAAADQVRVAQSRRKLAEDELKQARDRFASGVADTVEVVQAQEVVSSAEQNYIQSLSAHNLAKASVARATGQAEKIIRTLLRSR
ncbi:MAG TPA: TolC family protein [Candidatus Dormibacteraeota bacterium]|nr:TolC family protein [Candidatus Dormibacteraeota bacterium]